MLNNTFFIILFNPLNNIKNYFFLNTINKKKISLYVLRLFFLLVFKRFYIISIGFKNLLGTMKMDHNVLFFILYFLNFITLLTSLPAVILWKKKDMSNTSSCLRNSLSMCWARLFLCEKIFLYCLTSFLLLYRNGILFVILVCSFL